MTEGVKKNAWAPKMTRPATALGGGDVASLEFLAELSVAWYLFSMGARAKRHFFHSSTRSLQNIWIVIVFGATSKEWRHWCRVRGGCRARAIRACVLGRHERLG